MGKEVTDNGIISTSLKQNPSGIKGKYSIYFNLPEGYNAAYIEKISQHRGQEEMILLCETRFKSKTIKPNERGGYDIEVTYKELVYNWLRFSTFVKFYFEKLFHIPHGDEKTTKSKSDY